MADLLIVNMWTNVNKILKEKDVGRYAAANYGLLETIFEVNLRLFTQEWYYF